MVWATLKTVNIFDATSQVKNIFEMTRNAGRNLQIKLYRSA